MIGVKIEILKGRSEKSKKALLESVLRGCACGYKTVARDKIKLIELSKDQLYLPSGAGNEFVQVTHLWLRQFGQKSQTPF